VAEGDDVGKTARVGYEIGVRRTLLFSEERVWALLLSPDGLRMWLGGPAAIADGAPYTLANGTAGRISVYKPRSHLRLTWQPTGWVQPSTLQVRVIPASRGTTVSFHQEHLRDAAARTQMKAHWEQVIDSLTEMLRCGDKAE
jgi:uncharacterized protein YndB with AHSA1/START domain